MLRRRASNASNRQAALTSPRAQKHGSCRQCRRSRNGRSEGSKQRQEDGAQEEGHANMNRCHGPLDGDMGALIEYGLERTPRQQQQGFAKHDDAAETDKAHLRIDQE